MSNFNPGDTVRRKLGCYGGMSKGETDTVVKYVTPWTTKIGEKNGLWLEKYGMGHEISNFELVTKAAIGDPDDSGRDDVNHPKHYTSDPSGVECIQITRHRNFNIGNAFKYIWRLGLKESAGKSAKEKTLQDIDKAIWYLQDERKRIEAEA